MVCGTDRPWLRGAEEATGSCGEEAGGQPGRPSEVEQEESKLQRGHEAAGAVHQGSERDVKTRGSCRVV